MSKLYQDLVAIRKAKDLTTEDIFQKTRILPENIEKIENGSYLESKSDKVYARSFVRTYAKVIGISETDIVEALDQHYRGTYSSYLAKKYSVGDLPQVEKQPDEPIKEDESNKPTLKETIEEEEKVEPPRDKKKIEEPTSTTVSTDKKEGLFDFDKDLDKSDSPTVKAVRPEKKDAPNVDWAEFNAKKRVGKKKPMLFLPILLVFLVLLIGGALIWYFVGGHNNNISTDLELGDIPAVLDTIPTRELDTLRAPAAPDPELGRELALTDTLYIEVYAATGNLSPFQVRSDFFEGQRPYWLDSGVSMRIEFFNEITIINATGNMLLLYDGNVITEFAERNRDIGSFTFRRAQIEADPSLESFTRSDFPAGINEPREVINRPIIIQ